jgi:hypothetical protein
MAQEAQELATYRDGEIVPIQNVHGTHLEDDRAGRVTSSSLFII